MSFRYTLHLKDGTKIRSNLLPSFKKAQTTSQMTELLSNPNNSLGFVPEPKDSRVEWVIVPSGNVNYVSFLSEK